MGERCGANRPGKSHTVGKDACGQISAANVAFSGPHLANEGPPLSTSNRLLSGSRRRHEAEGLELQERRQKTIEQRMPMAHTRPLSAADKARAVWLAQHFLGRNQTDDDDDDKDYDLDVDMLDDGFRRCWGRNDCRSCLSVSACSWCPFVRSMWNPTFIASLRHCFVASLPRSFVAHACSTSLLTLADARAWPRAPPASPTPTASPRSPQPGAATPSVPIGPSAGSYARVRWAARCRRSRA